MLRPACQSARPGVQLAERPSMHHSPHFAAPSTCRHQLVRTSGGLPCFPANPRASTQPAHNLVPASISNITHAQRTSIQTAASSPIYPPISCSSGSNNKPPVDPPPGSSKHSGSDDEPSHGQQNGNLISYLLQAMLIWATAHMQQLAHTAALVLAVMAAVPLTAHAMPSTPSPTGNNGGGAGGGGGNGRTPGSAQNPLLPMVDESALHEDPLPLDMPKCPPDGVIFPLKRMLREVFADLITLKQQVEDLAPRSEDDDVVIPHEGGSVRPATRPVAPGVHLKAKAQVGGELSWTTPLITSGMDAGGAGALAGGGLPHMSVLVQTMWPDKAHSLTARLVSTGTPHPSSALGMGPSLTHEHATPASTHTPTTWHSNSTSTPGLALESLLYRCEALQGRLRLCMAPMGGSLSSMARRLNPTAGASGLTHIARHGHGIPMALEPGSGAVATWIAPGALGAHVSPGQREEGPLSASLGRFLMPGPRPVHHTLGQVSMHTQRHGCISLLMSSASHARSARSHAAHREMGRGTDTMPVAADTERQGAGSQQQLTVTQESDQPRKGGQGLVRLGLAACTTVADTYSVSAWHSRSLNATHADQGECSGSTVSAGGHTGVLMASGSSTGLQICSLPDARGMSVSITWAAVAPHGSAGGAAQAGPIAQTHDVSRASQGTGMGAVETGTNRHGLKHVRHVAELSAHVPLRDGVSVTPGVVLVGGQGCGTKLLLACGTNWKF